LHKRFGDIETGIYTLANDATLDWFVAFCNSVRRHDPDLPLIVIPYDDRVERLTRLAGRYGFEMLADSHLGSLDEIGRQMSSTGLSGMFRKLSVFWGPLTHFAYLDADLVMLSSISPAIEAIIQRRADLLVFDTSPTQVYRPSLRAQFPNSLSFNAGAFAGHRGLLTVQTAEELSRLAMPLRSEFAPTGDQPFLNYCADVERWSVRQASEVIGAGLVWAGWPTERHSPFVHWAGFRLTPLMPQRRRYLEHRLAGAGLGDRVRFWTRWLARSARHPLSLALTVRNRLRAARRWRAGEAESDRSVRAARRGDPAGHDDRRRGVP